jgi:hypothetical protein
VDEARGYAEFPDPFPDEVLNRIRQVGHRGRQNRHGNAEVVVEEPWVCDSERVQQPIQNLECPGAAQILRSGKPIETQLNSEMVPRQEVRDLVREQEPVRPDAESDAFSRGANRFGILHRPSEQLEFEERFPSGKRQTDSWRVSSQRQIDGGLQSLPRKARRRPGSLITIGAVKVAPACQHKQNAPDGSLL